VKNINEKVFFIFFSSIIHFIYLFIDRFTPTFSPILSNRGSASNGQTLINAEGSSRNNELMPVSKLPSSLTTTTTTTTGGGGGGGMYGDDDDDDDGDESPQFMPPKYITALPRTPSLQSPTIPLSMQKVNNSFDIKNIFFSIFSSIRVQNQLTEIKDQHLILTVNQV